MRNEMKNDKPKLTLVGSGGHPKEEGVEDALMPTSPTPTPSDIPQKMRVNQPNVRLVVFDCPWNGHLLSDLLVAMPKNVPMVGRVCVKCGSMVYNYRAEEKTEEKVN